MRNNKISDWLEVLSAGGFVSANHESECVTNFETNKTTRRGDALAHQSELFKVLK